MPDQLQLRGGTTTEHNSFTGVAREVTVDTTKKTLVVHDGSQAGGTPLMKESGGNAASTVQIGVGGANKLTINSDGHIDIASNLDCAAGIDVTGAITSTGGVQVTGGSLDINEKIRHLNDLDTFISFPQNDEIGFTTNNSTRLTINSSGRIGIGSTTPTQKVTIVGNNEEDLVILSTGNALNNTFCSVRGDNEAGIRIRGGGSGRGGEIELAGGGRNTEPAVIKFSTTTGNSFTERARFGNDSNLLIGKTTTSFTTDGIRADGTGLITVSRTSSSTVLGTANGGCLALCNPSNTDNNFSNVGFYKSDGLVTSQINGINVSQSSRHGALAFLVHNGSTLAEKVRITKDGRVGVGTVSPSTLMELSGGGNSTLTINTGNNSGDNSQLAFADSADGNVGFINYDHGTNNMQFRVNQAQRMHIDNTGDIGIGSNTINLQGVNRTVVSVNGSDSAALCFNRSDSITGFLFADQNEFRIQAEAAGSNLVKIRNNNGTICQFDDDGMKFNNDTAAANGLDDYEEGTWTPSGTGNAFQVAVGSYTKVGRCVTALFRIRIAASEGANFLQINGLPFDNVAGEQGENIGSISFSTSDLSGNIHAAVSTGTAILFYFGTGTNIRYNSTGVPNSHIRGGVVYYTAA